MTVHELPRQPLSAEDIAELEAALNAPMLDWAAVMYGPLEPITDVGPMVTIPSTEEFDDDLERLVAVANSLHGPTRVPMVIALRVIAVLAENLLDAATEDAGDEPVA